MKKLFYSLLLFLPCFSILAQPKINSVYFAQTHVVKFDYLIPNVNEKFKLISEREALLKVNITSPVAQVSPLVKARLVLFGDSVEINLTGSAVLPTSFNSTFGQVIHKLEDSFTGIIPKEWVKPGLKILVITPNEKIVYDNLSVSAPNRIFMTNFEINAFALQNSPFTTGWETEFGSKLPTAEFKVQNIPNILFPTIVSPPISGTLNAIKFSSLADYKTQTNTDFGTHNDAANQWKAALRDAAGLNYGNLNYVTVSWTYTDRPQKGVGGGYSSVQRRGGADGIGILLHEMGHALSLPHWGDAANYPYKGDMYGIDKGAVYNGTHAGPIWAYDYLKKNFIKPTITSTAPLVYKNDPMQGGGLGNPEAGYLVNHFSDYSVNQMSNMLENHLIIYNTSQGKYAKWSKTTKSYSDFQTNTGNVRYPIERNVDVISVMAAVSSKTAQANMVYPPIGPYKSGIITLFDPRVAADRTNADNFFCPNNGCDITLKILQGTTTRYMMLPIGLESSLLATDPASFFTKAVNLKAIDGEVLSVDILQTPNAEVDGLPANPIILASWKKINNTTSSNDQNQEPSNLILSIYPNPSSDKINFSLNEKIESISICNLYGQEVVSKQVNSQEFSLDMSHLPNGIYLAKLNNKGKSALVKLSKN